MMTTCNKGLLIDLDGTLVDNLDNMYGVYSTFLNNYQQRPSKNEFELFNGVPLGMVVESIKSKYALKPSKACLLTEYHELLDTVYQLSPLRPGALELLRKAKALNFKLSLVTSSPGKKVKRLLTTLKILEFFDLTICAEDVTRGKPNKEPYEKAIMALRLNTARTLAIEDSLNGLKAAFGSGVKTCYITPYLHQISAEEETFTWKQIHCLEEMLRLIDLA
jgi:HAD superfamily hydrolase (TIGR01509 family)